MKSNISSDIHPTDKSGVFYRLNDKGYFRSGFDCPEELLAQYGWEAEVIQPGDEAACFGRYTHQLPPRDVPDVERAFLISAYKK